MEVWHGSLTRLAKWYQNKKCGLQQARLLVEEAEWSLLQGWVWLVYYMVMLLSLQVQG